MIQLDSQTKDKRNKRYDNIARKRPAYISLIVPIVLGLTLGVDDYLVSKDWGNAIIYIISISAISASLFFFLRLFLRDISKLYPEKILFSKRIKPTTRLLYSNDVNFSDEKKLEIRKKIKLKKCVDLQQIRNKTHENDKYVKQVDEVVDWLLDVTRFDDILFDYNCIYGFYRNLTAAVFVDALLVFVLAAINKWWTAIPFGSVYLWLAIVLVFISVLIMYLAYSNGLIFAKKMYNVFLGLNDDINNY